MDQKIYVGEEAERIYDEILESERTSPKLVFPVHTGAQGVFKDGDKYVAFDNSTNSCCVEEFRHEEAAKAWLSHPLSAGQVDNMAQDMRRLCEQIYRTEGDYGLSKKAEILESHGLMATLRHLSDDPFKGYAPLASSLLMQLEQLTPAECQHFASPFFKSGLTNTSLYALEGAVTDEIILTAKSFEALRRPKDKMNNGLPPNVRFDENGEMPLMMDFMDGYAYDRNPHGMGYYDRIGLYYPTLQEVECSPAMKEKIEHTTGRSWDGGTKHEKIHDIAISLGQASRLHCPEYRYEAALEALVARSSDPSAKAFTAEQRRVINLAADCNGYKDSPQGRTAFFNVLIANASDSLSNVPSQWKADANSELRDMAWGKERGETLGLRR